MPSQYINGVHLRYEVVGSGPALVLIIGYRLHGRAWPSTFVDELARNFSVVTFDNRGTGLSDKPASGYSIESMATDVDKLLGSLDIPKAHVLGFSMGGAIAQELALNCPQRIDRLVLFATFPGFGFGIPAASSSLNVLFDVEGLTPEQAAKRVWPLTYSAQYLEENAERVEEQMRREIALPTPDHAARGQREGLRSFTSSFRLWRLKAHTLVATGAEDQIVPPANSRILAAGMPNAELAIIPGLGHRAIWEAPEKVAALVSEFLRNTSTALTSNLQALTAP